MALSVRYSVVNGMVLSENRGGVLTEFVPDTLGSVWKTRDVSGAVTSTTEYWPYGEVRTQSGVNPSRFGYVGLLGYLTDLLNLLYVRARFYKPDRAMWLTVDPLWPSQAGYTYTQNLPNLNDDATGLASPRKGRCSFAECRRTKSKGACFACYYAKLSSNDCQFNLCPKKACDIANKICGSHVLCKECGAFDLTGMPPIPSSCCDVDGWNAIGHWLRGSGTGGIGQNCGGVNGADKMAHCLKGCLVGACLGFSFGILGDPEQDDVDAEDAGLECGRRIIVVESAFQTCLKCCADATYESNCW